MEQAREPKIPAPVETSPSRIGGLPPPVPLDPNFIAAWYFQPCPTDQQRDAFLRGLTTLFAPLFASQNLPPPDVRSTGCMKGSTGPVGTHPFVADSVQTEVVGVWAGLPINPTLLQQLEFLVQIPPSGNTFAYLFNGAVLDQVIQNEWKYLCPPPNCQNCPGTQRFNSSGECDPNGPIHLTSFSYFFQSPGQSPENQIVVVTHVEGSDSDYTPTLDFQATITDTVSVSATGGSTLQYHSTQDVHTNYPQYLEVALAFLALILRGFSQIIALALLGSLASGGAIPGANVPLSGGIGAMITGSPDTTLVFRDVLSQPIVTFNYTHLDVSANRAGIPDRLFASGTLKWFL